MNMLERFRSFRRLRLFVTPAEHEAALAATRASMQDMAERERADFKAAARRLSDVKVGFRRSAHMYRVEFEIDSEAVAADEARVIKFVAEEVAEKVRHRHRMERMDRS